MYPDKQNALSVKNVMMKAWDVLEIRDKNKLPDNLPPPAYEPPSEDEMKCHRNALDEALPILIAAIKSRSDVERVYAALDRWTLEMHAQQTPVYMPSSSSQQQTRTAQPSCFTRFLRRFQ